MNNKKLQKATDLPEVNGLTGLTPIQEQAAMLLASGETLTAVADKVNVNRSTIHKWQAQITFQCFFNRQCADLRSNLRNGLFGLADEALAAIRESLHSENESIRLKAAMWLTEKIELADTGSTDVKEVLKGKNTKNSLADWGDLTTFDEKAFKDDCKKLGLDDIDTD